MKASFYSHASGEEVDYSKPFFSTTVESFEDFERNLYKGGFDPWTERIGYHVDATGKMGRLYVCNSGEWLVEED